MADHWDETHEAWVNLTSVDVDWPGQVILACGEPSPGGKMLCDLPRTDLWHHMGQHLGQDRHGNFRGWRDRRAPE